MRAPALHSLLAKLLSDHRGRGEMGFLHVVPVVLVDDVDETDEADAAFQELLAASARYSHGEFADAGIVARDDPRSLVDEPVLRGAVTSGLTFTQGATTRQLAIGADGDVVLGDTDITIASDGERELIGLARALLDERWQHRRLGLLTYSERNMARPMVRACWNTIATALNAPAINVGGLRTLLVVVRTPRLDYEIHCSARSGAHYVLDQGRLVPRSTPARARDLATTLARTTSSHIVVFLGAGFSYSSRLPLGDALRDQALRRRYQAGSDVAIEELAIRLFRDSQRDGLLVPHEDALGEDRFAAQLTLEQVVRIESVLANGISQTLEDFRELHDRARAGPAVTRLVEILGHGPKLVLVTVNFDEVLDAEAGNRLRPFVTEQELRNFRTCFFERYLAGEETAVPLLKLHGTISDPASCVVSAEVTERGLPEHKREALFATISGGERIPLTYVGASLRDVDVAPVFQDPRFPSQTEEFWVTPLREPSIDSFAAGRLAIWKREGRDDLEERVVATTADEFFAHLAEQITAA